MNTKEYRVIMENSSGIWWGYAFNLEMARQELQAEVSRHEMFPVGYVLTDKINEPFGAWRFLVRPSDGAWVSLTLIEVNPGESLRSVVDRMRKPTDRRVPIEKPVFRVVRESQEDVKWSDPIPDYNSALVRFEAALKLDNDLGLETAQRGADWATTMDEAGDWCLIKVVNTAKSLAEYIDDLVASRKIAGRQIPV